MIVFFLVLLAFFGISGFSSSSPIESGSTTAVPTARVPAVTGLAPPAAQRRIRRAGLVPSATGCHSSGSAYAVKGQRPAAGTTVPRGASVKIRVVGQDGMPCSAISGARP